MPPRSGLALLGRYGRGESLLLAAVLAAWWCVAVGSTLQKSCTSDEFFHMIGGASYWWLNDYRLQPENGNLPQRWCAIPLVLAGWPLPSFEHPGWSVSNMVGLSRAYLFETGNPSWWMIISARCFAATWGVLVGLLVYRWSRELFGPEGAWLSLAFCLADTTLLANAPLATSDTCAAFFFGWSTLAIWRMLQLPSLKTAIVTALAVAGLFVAKFSAPVEIPVGIILLAIRSCYGPEWEVSWRGQPRRVSTYAGLATVGACLLLVGLVAWLIVWLSFGCRYEAMNMQAAPSGTLCRWGTLNGVTKTVGGFKGHLLAFLGEHHILPEGYLYGMAYVLSTLWRQSFFCGDYSIEGWWSYFPFTFLVKTPLPPLTPGTYCISATHLQGIYLLLWGPWRESWEEKYQNQKRALALLTPLSVEERQKAHGITQDVFVQIGKEFQLLEYHRFLAQLREREPDEVLNGAILIYRLDPATFDALLAAGPPAQAARFIE